MPITLRRIVDIVAVTAALGLVGGVGWYGYDQFDHHRQMKKVSGELRRFNQILSFQAASGQTQITSRGWPATVDPAWFGDHPPRNPLVSQDRPWVEIATLDQLHMDDPPIRVALDRSLAMFWYNPFRGVIRARVPMQISDQKSLALYNEANGTWVATLYDLSPAPAAPAPTDDDPQTANVPADDGK